MLFQRKFQSPGWVNFSSLTKIIMIIVVLALLDAGLSNAGDYTGTNHSTEQVRNLMNSENYVFYHKCFDHRNLNTNSLRNLQFIERRQFIQFVLPLKKEGWSLWNNSSFKYARSNTDPTSGIAPFEAFAHVEYDISYSFYF